jgi:hypothetical protein
METPGTPSSGRMLGCVVVPRASTGLPPNPRKHDRPKSRKHSSSGEIP